MVPDAHPAVFALCIVSCDPRGKSLSAAGWGTRAEHPCISPRDHRVTRVWFKPACKWVCILDFLQGPSAAGTPPSFWVSQRNPLPL